jgi:hypothetical protein
MRLDIRRGHVTQPIQDARAEMYQLCKFHQPAYVRVPYEPLMGQSGQGRLRWLGAAAMG